MPFSSSTESRPRLLQDKVDPWKAWLERTYPFRRYIVDQQSMHGVRGEQSSQLQVESPAGNEQPFLFPDRSPQGGVMGVISHPGSMADEVPDSRRADNDA